MSIWLTSEHSLARFPFPFKLDICAILCPAALRLMINMARQATDAATMVAPNVQCLAVCVNQKGAFTSLTSASAVLCHKQTHNILVLAGAHKSP